MLMSLVFIALIAIPVIWAISASAAQAAESPVEDRVARRMGPAHWR